jgi:hypothetical protein
VFPHEFFRNLTRMLYQLRLQGFEGPGDGAPQNEQLGAPGTLEIEIPVKLQVSPLRTLPKALHESIPHARHPWTSGQSQATSRS